MNTWAKHVEEPLWKDLDFVLLKIELCDIGKGRRLLLLLLLLLHRSVRSGQGSPLCRHLAEAVLPGLEHLQVPQVPQRAGERHEVVVLDAQVRQQDEVADTLGEPFEDVCVEA